MKHVAPLALAGALLVGLMPAPARAVEPAGRLDRLRVLGKEYPQVFFFRSAEGWAANPRIDYAQWEATFSRLMGIQGKALDEEVPGRGQRNPAFFTRFKQAHPDQVVLLHYNGNARDPQFEREPFFAGHWVYYVGATVVGAVPAETGRTEIRVDHPERFRTEMGRFRDKNDDVGLCALDADGRPDWHTSEQVRLVSVDPRRKVIVVERGCYGTQPRAFAAGRAYAAAHATEGPWPRQGNLMWFYNYSTHSPKDAQGRRCWEVHADDLAARFAPGGALAAFDGIEFDVLFNERGGERADANADGQGDAGVIDGVQTYGLGVIRFLERLRACLGDDRLITADGHQGTHQRGVGILNGIESEGWPSLSDREITDWSGGLNRHDFWAARSRRPVFNYVNHKFIEPTGIPGRPNRRPDVPWATHRLVFAASVMTDSAICYSFSPPKVKGELCGLWDELVRGRDHVVGWLGQAKGPARRLALDAPDRLNGLAAPPGEALLKRLIGKGLRFAIEGGAVKVTAADTPAGPMRFVLRDVPCDGPDLVVRVTARAAPLPGYPEAMPRLAHVGVAPPQGKLVVPRLPETGMQVRGKAPAALDRDTGASVRYSSRTELGGQTHAAYLVHPPYKSCAGATFWQRDVAVPAGGRLTFATGMGPKSPEKSDGVWFRVCVAPLDEDGKAGPFEQVFEHTQKASEWVRHEVPLAPWAGRRVRLRFVSDCGPNDNATTDHASWADALVTGPGRGQAVTEPVRYMTWADREAFTSYAYVSAVRSKTVDLAFEFEGTAPVWLASVTAHAAADTVVRAFERGLVLANPSPHDVTFDLARLAPGRRLSRLRGSPRQDPDTNNGKPVGNTVTLGPKDALFLVDAEASGP